MLRIFFSLPLEILSFVVILVLQFNSLNAGEFGTLFCRLLIFSKVTFSKNSFRNTSRVSNSLNPDQARLNVRPDLGPNFLQGFLADDKSFRSISSRIWAHMVCNKGYLTKVHQQMTKWTMNARKSSFERNNLTSPVDKELLQVASNFFIRKLIFSKWNSASCVLLI